MTQQILPNTTEGVSVQQREELEAIINASQDAVSKWLQNNSPEKVEREVTAYLNKNKTEIIPKLLGFDKDYFGSSAWKLDHCNGRSGNSPIGDIIRQKKQAAIDNWVAEVGIESLTKGMQAEVKKEFERDISYSIRKLIEKEATRLVSEEVNRQAGQVEAEIKKLFEANSTMTKLITGSK